MPLAISNIAWTNPEDPLILEALRLQRVAGIEVAPTKIWPSWEGATAQAARVYRHRMEDLGFEIPALQAILFGLPECQLFGDERQRAALIDQIRLVADLAAELRAQVMILGAPSNRDRRGIATEEAFEMAVEAFTVIGSECAARGTTCCIEPNPSAYGCNFITTSADGLALVEAVSSAGFGLHLDAAGMLLAGEDGPTAVRACIRALRHFHISEPRLGLFDSPEVGHAALGRALAESAYAGWVSIEMRASKNEVNAVARACEVVRQAYAPVLR